MSIGVAIISFTSFMIKLIFYFLKSFCIKIPCQNDEKNIIRNPETWVSVEYKRSYKDGDDWECDYNPYTAQYNPEVDNDHKKRRNEHQKYKKPTG